MSDKEYNIAILGATGNVGRLLLEILEERNFPYKSIKLLASERSVGQIMESPSLKKYPGRNLASFEFSKRPGFKDKYKIELAEPSAFDDVDIVFASAGAKVSAQLAPEIVKRGGIIIDNSSQFRMDPEVPLVVPEVNADDLRQHRGIIANPNCSTAPLVVVLKPLDKKFKIKRVVVSTYQSVSGAGKAAIDELLETTKKAVSNEQFENKFMNQKIAFNLIPHIDVFQDNGYTKEEMKVVNESRKMMNRPDLKITCTAVRVPVFICHSESVNIEFEANDGEKPTLKQVREILENAPLIKLVDEPHSDPKKARYPMPLDVAGTDPVYVGRLRVDESQPNSFNMWIVSDNLRIGAALNAVKIGEELVRQGLILSKKL